MDGRIRDSPVFLSLSNVRIVLYLHRSYNHSILSAQVHGAVVSLPPLVYLALFVGQSPEASGARSTPSHVQIVLLNSFLESACVFFFKSHTLMALTLCLNAT